MVARRKNGMGRRMLAWCLAVAMVVTGLSIPAGRGTVKAEDTREFSSGVTATIQNQDTPSSDWSGFDMIIKNNSGTTICDWIVKIQVPSGTASAFKCWNATFKAEGDTIFLYPMREGTNAVVEQGELTKDVPGGGFVSTYVDASSIQVLGVYYNKGNSSAYDYSSGETNDNSSGTGGGSGSVVGELNYELTGLKNVAASDTPLGKHGALSLAEVDGYTAPIIVDKNGKPYQLRGASTHGMQWFPDFVNQSAFQTLRDDWGVNMVRLVCYPRDYAGYTTSAANAATLDGLIEKGVEAASNLGMYAIVDWHVHNYNPNETKNEAITFFTKYAQKYANQDNIIYEICNEPTNTPWYNNNDGNDLYSYCKEVAGVIRQYDKDALIVCGTNTWSQDVDAVAARPLKNDGFSNILYTFHFYSGSHGEDLKNRVKTAASAGTPLFVTEFGICDASGNGGYNTDNATSWIELFDSLGVSYACWSFCNKPESASYIKDSCSKTTGGWTANDLTTTGLWLINTYRAHQDKEDGTNTSTGGNSGNTGGSGNTTGGNTGGSGNTTGGTGENTGGTGGSGTNTGNAGENGGTGNASGENGNGAAGNGGNGTVGNTTGGNITGGGTTITGGGGGTGTGTGVTSGDETGDGNGNGQNVSLKKVKIKKVKAAKKKITVKWKKVKGASAYQIQVSRKRNFKKAKKVKVRSGKKTKKVIKKLKSKKKYFVRIRAVSKENGTQYGAWSKVKKVKVK